MKSVSKNILKTENSRIDFVNALLSNTSELIGRFHVDNQAIVKELDELLLAEDLKKKRRFANDVEAIKDDLEGIESSIRNLRSRTRSLMEQVIKSSHAMAKEIDELLSGVESGNDIILSTDLNGRIVAYNNTFKKITGLNSSDLRGKSFVKMLGEKDQERFLTLTRQLVNGEEVGEAQFSILIMDKEVVDASWRFRFATMEDEKGVVIGIIIIGRVLTKQKSLQAKLTQSAKMASLGTMAGGIAHDIRNPLAIIDASAQILKTQGANDGIRNACIDKIRNSTKRANEIVNNLIRFARPSKFALAKLDIHKVIDAALDLIHNTLSNQQIEVNKNYATSLPMIYGYENQLLQVFMNIILNARNAMEEGGTIIIQTATSDDSITVRFQDNGIGIPKKYLARIFDSFFTTQPDKKRIGLGLCIARRIIDNHNGSIEVESQLGSGSIFTVKLPLKR